MLLPERINDLSRFADRSLWSIVEGAELSPRACDASRLAALNRCSLVVARRRHGAWHGPIAGFRVAPPLRRAWLMELLDVDVCPWEGDDARSIFDHGVASVLEYARLFGTERPRADRKEAALAGIIVPVDLGGPRVQQWKAEHGPPD